MFSATYQDLSGPSIDANYAATNDEIMASLGRPLAGGRRAATVPLVAPQTLFEARIRRLDLRVSKILYAGRFRFQINFDAYNALNTSSVLGGEQHVRLALAAARDDHGSAADADRRPDRFLGACAAERNEVSSASQAPGAGGMGRNAESARRFGAPGACAVIR